MSMVKASARSRPRRKLTRSEWRILGAQALFLAVFLLILADFLGQTRLPLSFGLALLVLISEAGYLSYICLRDWQSHPESLVLVFVLYSAFGWALTPATAAILTGYFDVFTFGYGLDTWTLGLWLESLFFACFLLGWHFRGGRVFPVAKREPRLDLNFVILIAIASGLAYLALYGPWSSSGYDTAGDYLHADLSSEGITKGGLQNTVFNAVLLPCTALLILYFPKSVVPRWARFSSIGILAFAALKALSYGTRAAPLVLAFLISATLMLAKKTKQAIVIVGGSIVGVALLSATLIAVRGSSAYKEMTSYERAGSMMGGNQNSPSFGSEQWVELYLIRLDSVQNSAILAKETSASGRFAGVQPFIGAAVATIPRLFWQSKPMPLSMDNTQSGLPWYICMDYRNEPTNNGSVSAAGIAYWQFGILGVLAFGFIAGVTTRMLGNVGFNKGGLGALLFLSYCGLSGYRVPIGFDEFVLIINQLWLPLLIAYFFYENFWPKKGLPEEKFLVRVSSRRASADQRS